MAKNLNRPPSGICTAGNTAGPTGSEVKSDSKCTGTDAKCTGADNLDEGSIRQDQTGYAGS